MTALRANPKPTGELLTITELGERLRIHPDTLRGMYRRGQIPGLRISYRTLRFDYEKVIDALETIDGHRA